MQYASFSGLRTYIQAQIEELRSQAGATHSYDIRAQRDGQGPDVNGNTIPLSASQGHVHWSVRGAESKALIGRVEQFNLANGSSMTAACGACCPDSYQDSWLTPGSVSGVIGDTSQFTSIRRDIDCYGGLRSPYPFYSGSWSSDNTSVSTVNSTGLTTAMGIGSTLIHSYYNADQWSPVPPDYNSCQDFYFSANTAGSATVKPIITVTKGLTDKILSPETVSLANLVNVTGKINISASHTCQAAECPKPDDKVLVEIIENTPGGTFGYQPSQNQEVALNLGGTTSASFTIAVSTSTPPASYTFTIRVGAGTVMCRACRSITRDGFLQSPILIILLETTGERGPNPQRGPDGRQSTFSASET